MVVVDVHCHTMVPGFLDEIRRVAAGSSRHAEEARHLLARPGFCGDPQMVGALDERIALMDEAGIDVQIVSAAQAPSNFFDSVQLSADATRSSNSELSAFCARYPIRYRFFATLPLPYVQPSVDELERAAKLVGFAGVIMYTNFGLPLDDPGLDDLYRELSRIRAVLFIHPTRMAAVGRYGRHGMETMIGWPAEDTQSIMELILGGVLDRFPDLAVICPHLSGTLLYLLGRIDHSVRGAPPEQRMARELPSWYVKRMYHDSVTLWAPALNLARSVVGADHIVLGSDFPFWSRERLGECLDVVNSLDWPEEELELVRGRNVERLLRERHLW